MLEIQSHLCYTTNKFSCSSTSPICCSCFCNFYLWGHLKNKVYALNPRTSEELEASIRCEIDCILEIELIHVNAHFLKRWQKCVGEGGQHF